VVNIRARQVKRLAPLIIAITILTLMQDDLPGIEPAHADKRT
jgi:hypothetical protein